MSRVQISLKEALVDMPSWALPTVAALKDRGVEVTCWAEEGRWVLQGTLKGQTRCTSPTQALSGWNIEELWALMKPLLAE
ncbi:hypothetical protein E7T06_19065 [Deinococcus sp. Arct2-2]|uniref:hypothetical protein n=1 Tax=Deinococcus sp. Arct2-2 TaxID=2568653 RepID=UPI0010A58C5C|nr:hypothetical protein [Deinococcus sp. Arct2-2]THF67893.1 hypothetical protein E7T06_19065 [Deinococcus sp. Arct2-2]